MYEACCLPEPTARRPDVDVFQAACLLLTDLGMQGIGDDDNVESSSTGLQETEEGFQPVFFDPQPLKNLLLIDEMDSLCPITDMKVSYWATRVSSARACEWMPFASCKPIDDLVGPIFVDPHEGKVLKGACLPHLLVLCSGVCRPSAFVALSCAMHWQSEVGQM